MLQRLLRRQATTLACRVGAKLAEAVHILLPYFFFLDRLASPEALFALASGTIGSDPPCRKDAVIVGLSGGLAGAKPRVAQKEALGLDACVPWHACAKQAREEPRRVSWSPRAPATRWRTRGEAT